MRTLAVLIALFVLSSCATAAKLRRLSAGMTKEEAIATMGEPDGATLRGEGEEVLQYNLAWDSEAAFYGNKAPYGVVFKDGKLWRYGHWDSIFPPSAEELQARRERAAAALQMMQAFRSSQPAQPAFTPVQAYQMPIQKQTNCTTQVISGIGHTRCSQY